MSEVLVFVGAYASAEESGVEIFRLNEQTGELTKLSEFVGLTNPTFLNVDTHKQQIYSLSETINEDGSKAGAVARLSFDLQNYSLKLEEQIKSTNTTTCHIQRDECSRFLTVASYHGGSVGLIELGEDGSLKGLVDVVIHPGTKDQPEPQNKPRAHSTFYSPDENYLFVQDLGFDQIVSYKIDKASKKLVKHGTTQLTDGAGPRHLVFHPNGHFAYVINELNSTVTAFQYDAEEGALTELQSISTLPDQYEGFNATAEITISKDGKFLYGSNRGHDSIVVYKVFEDGKLSKQQHISTGGGHPRHFSLTPSGKHLLVTNRDGNNIVTFKVNQETGLLTETGHEAFSTKPVCVKPVIITCNTM